MSRTETKIKYNDISFIYIVFITTVLVFCFIKEFDIYLRNSFDSIKKVIYFYIAIVLLIFLYKYWYY